MADYLLDADVVIEWLKPKSRSVDTIADLIGRGETLAVNAVVVAEVFSGLSDDERRPMDRILSALEYWPLDVESAVLAGSYRRDFSRRGRPLAVTDSLIGAQALSRDATLYTGNTSDFPMPGLRILRMK